LHCVVVYRSVLIIREEHSGVVLQCGVHQRGGWRSSVLQRVAILHFTFGVHQTRRLWIWLMQCVAVCGSTHTLDTRMRAQVRGNAHKSPSIRNSLSPSLFLTFSLYLLYLLLSLSLLSPSRSHSLSRGVTRKGAKHGVCHGEAGFLGWFDICWKSSLEKTLPLTAT